MDHMFLANPFRWADPRTWPWIVYVWLALIAVGWLKPLWRWFQRNRANGWPSAAGQIESVSVSQSKRSFFSTSRRGSSPTYVAELGYSYSLAGSVYAGRFKREFGTEAEAWEFLRDLKGKPVSVQYNPNKPSTSTLIESSIESLLRTRMPAPVPDALTYAAANPVPPWLAPLLWVFIALAAVGLVVSLWVHLGAVMGRRVAPEAFFWILHVGIFVVWIPAVFVAKARVGNMNRKDFWKVVLQGSPDWMRYMVYGFLGYAVFNFAMFMLKAPPTGSTGESARSLARVLGSLDGVLLRRARHSIRSSEREPDVLAVLNGDPVPATASFCARCRQPAIHT